MPSDFDIQYVARLARLSLSPAEEEQFGAQLAGILGYIEKLKQLDVERHRADRPRRAAGQCLSPRPGPAFLEQRGGVAQRSRQGQRPVRRS